MAKQIAILIGLSALAALFMGQLAWGLNVFVKLHQWVYQGLGVVFAGDYIAKAIQATLALLIVPSLIGLVVALIHWFVKRSMPVYLMTLIWVLWTVLLCTVALSGAIG